MGLRERLAKYQQPWEAVRAVATCRDSLFFADLWFPPLDFEKALGRLMDHADRGVIFETAWRVVVVEEYDGELRFYAGGWGDHVYDQPYELGVFRSVEGVIHYAEAFLVRRLHPEQIIVWRGILSATYHWDHEEPDADSRCP